MNNHSKVLVLWGKSNSGKTATLNELINLLISKQYKTINQCKNISIVKDNRCFFEFDGKLLGITTRGDDRKCLEEDFNKIPNCDIYVAAAHCKGETVDFFRDNFKKENIYWFAKSRLSRDDAQALSSNLYDSINKSQAQDIFNILCVI